MTVATLDSGFDANTVQTKHAHLVRRYCPVCSSNRKAATTAGNDPLGHGTDVAETLLGASWSTPAKGRMLGGMAPDVNLIAERVLPGVGSSRSHAPDQALIEGVRDAIAYGAKIINVSLAFTDILTSQVSSGLKHDDRDLAKALEGAAHNGDLVVLSAGNAGGASPDIMGGFPTLYGNQSNTGTAWLVVAGINPNTGKHDAASNACGMAAAYCLSAPYETTVAQSHTREQKFPPNAPVRFYGTSAAAPVVSSAAALVWQKYPWLTGRQVGEVLLGTATPMGTGHHDKTYGWGALDVHRALGGPADLAWGAFEANVPKGVWTFANSLTGSGSLVKSGPGTLVLTGNDNYAGFTEVRRGNLEVDGTLRSPLTIDAAGQLSGTGLVDANVAVRGTLTTGLTTAGIGKVESGLAVVGNLTLDTGSTYQVVLGSPAKAKTADIEIGVDARVLGAVDGYTPSGNQMILWTKDGLRGKFATVTAGPGIALKATAHYTPYAANLDVRSLTLAKAVSDGVATPPSATTLRAASHLQGIMDRADAMAHKVLASGVQTTQQSQLLTAAGLLQQAPNALELAKSVRSLSGASYPTILSLEREGLDTIGNAYARHALREDGSSTRASWVQYVRRGARHGGDGYTTSTQETGIVAATDVRAGSTWELGAGIQGTQLAAHIPGNAGRDHVTNRGISLFAIDEPFSSWRYGARIFAGHVIAHVHRIATIGMARSAANARLDTFYVGAVVHGSYRFMLAHDAVLAPVIRLRGARLHTSAFRETGLGALDVSVSPRVTEGTTGGLGLAAYFSFPSGTDHFSLRGRLMRWLRYSGAQSGFRMDYIGNLSRKFISYGMRLAEKRWGADVALVWSAAGGPRLSIGYEDSRGGRQRAHASFASFRYLF